MRVGSNPQKSESLLKLKTNHRIVVVTFIPELTGYYGSMFEVIKLCITSLIKTIPDTSAITIVDNASCPEVVDYFVNTYKENKIDTLQLLATNVGKVDALMGAARSAREPIVTLADCDILFKTSWAEETIAIFNNFKNVGSVSPYPTRRGLQYYTYALQHAVISNKLKVYFEPIPENFEHYNQFLESINWDKETDPKALWPIVKANNVEAVVGSDHQVVTVRRDILFNDTPAIPSMTKVGKESERDYVDLAIDTSGGYRLATYYYLAHHMGNQVEPWMQDVVDNLIKTSETLELNLTPPLSYHTKSHFWYKIKKRVAKIAFKYKVPKTYFTGNK